MRAAAEIALQIELTMKSSNRLLLALLATLVIAACGQKGPLYLPESETGSGTEALTEAAREEADESLDESTDQAESVTTD